MEDIKHGKPNTPRQFMVQRSPLHEHHKDHREGHIGKYDVVELNTEGKCGRFVVSGIEHGPALEIATVFNSYHRDLT